MNLNTLETMGFDYDDTNFDNPRDWDNLFTIETFVHDLVSIDQTNHNSLEVAINMLLDANKMKNVEDEEFNEAYDTLYERNNTTEEFFSDLIEIAKEQGILIVPVDVFVHSGVKYSVDPNPFSEVAGIAYAKISTLKKEIQHYSEEKAIKYLESEIKTYNQYINGEVYTARLYNKFDKLVDSIGGIYVDDDKSLIDEGTLYLGGADNTEWISYDAAQFKNAIKKEIIGKPVNEEMINAIVGTI